MAELKRTKSKEKWRCDACSFDNIGLITVCEICDTPKKELPGDLERSNPEKVHLKMEDEYDPIIICPHSGCGMKNALLQEYCKKCHRVLLEDEGVKPKMDKLVNCESCGFENAEENVYCLSCLETVKLPIPMKSVSRPRKIKRGAKAAGNYCGICGTYSLSLQCTVCWKDDGLPVRIPFCNYCFKKINPDRHDDHSCIEKMDFFDTKKNRTFHRCSRLQIDTMLYMHQKSLKRHYQSQDALQKRIRSLGYSLEQLQNLHHYIVHYAPIIIHMHVNTHFQFFLKDTHYRNQFETAKSSGSLSSSARTSWQDRMFDRKHHHASGFERVKYGTMNFTNDPKGVRACLGYGQSYFLLKSHVRDRCTMTDMDSSSPSSTISTFRFVFHLLNKLSDAQIKAAFEGAKAQEMNSHVIAAYKQIQIHGPVQFSQDIERVYISKEELKLGNPEELLEMVKSFCSKNKIEYELIQGEKPAGYGGLGGPVAAVKAPNRFVGGKTQLTEEDLKKPEPVVFGGGPFGGGFVGGPFGGGFVGSPFGVLPHPMPVYSPPRFHAPKKVKKFQEDYI